MLSTTTLYLVSAGLHGLCLLYLLAFCGGRLVRNYVLAVLLVGGGVSLWHAGAGERTDLAVYAADTLLLIAWYMLLERYLRGPYLQSMPELVRRGMRVTLFLIVAAAVVVSLPWAIPEGGLTLPAAERAYTLGLLASALLLLAIGAQFFGEPTLEQPVPITCISLAVIFVALQQVLPASVQWLSGITPEWMTAGQPIALAVAALLVTRAMQLRPQWSLAIFVSPQARVYTPRVLITLVYLLVVAVLGTVLQSVAGPYVVEASQLTVLLFAAVMLTMLYSERLRAQLRVFVSKHFLPFRYDYREEWLRLIDTLAAPEEEEPLPERAIRALAQIVGSPAGVLWVMDNTDGRYRCTSAWNTNSDSAADVAAGDPALAFMLERHWILDTAELQREPDMYPGIRRPQWLDAFPEGLLVVPLISKDELMGFVVLFQSSSAFRLTFEEIDLLRTSGRQVAAHLAQYLADRQIAESKQFEAFNRLTAFVMHDLKNLIAQQSLMVRNATKHKNNPAFFEDAMATIDNSVARMNKLLQQLQSGEASGPREQFRVAEAVFDAMAKCEGSKPSPQIGNVDEDVRAWIERERFTAVLAHLIRNAQEATENHGQVSVSVEGQGEGARIVIEDNGCGMDEVFIRERLFRPFDSTKGSQGMGIGAYQARSFLVAAGGSMAVDSTPGDGTRVTITVPAPETEAAEDA